MEVRIIVAFLKNDGFEDPTIYMCRWGRWRSKEGHSPIDITSLPGSGFVSLGAVFGSYEYYLCFQRFRCSNTIRSGSNTISCKASGNSPICPKTDSNSVLALEKLSGLVLDVFFSSIRGCTCTVLKNPLFCNWAVDPVLRTVLTL